jgi:UDP-2-acetamido-3-amino-2,3-dideoxy-glucuronate N-acetyltransferase
MSMKKPPDNPAVFIHENALVEPGACIGARTRVWAFAHILPGARIGEDCNVCDHVLIENQTRVGNRVTIKSGVQLWDGVTLEDDVFVGPNATFTNDNFPRSKQHLSEPVRTVVRYGASIGANATILAGVMVGVNAMVGAGAVVTRNVPPHAIVKGNPARITGYVSAAKEHCESPKPIHPPEATGVPGVRVYDLPLYADLRGSLSVCEYEQYLPFQPKRHFIVFDVPSKEVRGEHAHRQLQQFLICVKGSCSVVVDDGKARDEVLLDRPDLGIHLPPMIWTTQYKYSPDAVLLVIASGPYNPEDYIRSYDEFLAAVNG